MRRFRGLLLCWAAGCSGFAPATEDQLRSLSFLSRPSPAGPPVMTRTRLRMSVDSPALSGEFDGVAVGREGGSPIVRAQFFGDLGPKMIDLLASPGRILGLLPQTRQAVDCALPAEAAVHPILLIGVSLLEQFSPVSPERVIGIRETAEGCWLRLKPTVPGVETVVLFSPDGRLAARRFRWIHGLQWDERWETARRCRITAADLKLQVEILEVEGVAQPGTAFELSIPPDVPLVKGSRK